MTSIKKFESLKKKDLFYIACLSEQTDRHSESLKFMKILISKTSQDLSLEERNLFSKACSSIVRSICSSWHIVNSIEQKEAAHNIPNKKILAHNYKAKIEAELEKYCKDIISVIDSDLLQRTSSHESLVFYHQMKGDYFGYVSVHNQGYPKSIATNNAETSYFIAYELAKNNLIATDPIRLNLALNFSVFYFETRKEPQRAYQLAKNAFDEAILVIDIISEENYIEAIPLLNILKDNLSIWGENDSDNHL